MNKSNYHLEEEIKRQIGEREIKPSRDLWTEIETQNLNNHPAKSKMNWFLAAACFLLLASLGVILIFNNDKKAETQIVETKIQPQKNKVEKIVAEDVSPIQSEKIENFKVKNDNLVSAQRLEKSQPTSVLEKIKSSNKEEKKESVFSTLPENTISSSGILASTDSVNTPPKRKKYVDASTLLFSVEHKDVIENSKDGSNVATIDLNSK